MARKNCVLLDNGDPFPVLQMDCVEGGRITLPEELEGQWGVFFVYRGHLCSFSRHRLADFQKHLKEFEKKDIRVIAASADDWQHSLQTVERQRLGFKVGFGLDADEFSRRTGAFYSPGDGLIYPCGFIISPEGKVEAASYSSRAIGGLDARECLEFLS